MFGLMFEFMSGNDVAHLLRYDAYKNYYKSDYYIQEDGEQYHLYIGRKYDDFVGTFTRSELVEFFENLGVED